MYPIALAAYVLPMAARAPVRQNARAAAERNRYIRRAWTPPQSGTGGQTAQRNAQAGRDYA